MGGKRVDIKTGFLCNNNCRFCVQADNKNNGNRTFEDIKKDLIDSRKRCDGVVFTGGEVTIRDDFFDLVNLAKELGYKEIQIQTNGRMFASMDFCKKTIEAGANVFGLALHGYCKEQHDFLTESPGSFKETAKGIINLKKLGQVVGTNTVVTKPNYRDCEKIAKLLVELKVNNFQFAFVHPMSNAWTNFDSIVPFISEAAPFIHKGLNIGRVAGVKCIAEAMPFCLMGGYEGFVGEKNIPQTEIRGLKHQNIDNFTKQRQTHGKLKFTQCKVCKYDYICEGPWMEYPKKRGENEFKPVLYGDISKGELDCIFNFEYSFDLLALIIGIKPSVRAIINNNKIPQLKKICKKFNLNFIFSDVFVKQDDDKSLIVGETQPNSIAYISKSQLGAKLLKGAEDQKDFYNVGLLLGYPDCCINFYCDLIKNKKHSELDFVMETVKKTGGKFDFRLNNIGEYARIGKKPHSLIDFFPCSYDCSNALHYASEIYNYIYLTDKNLANKIKMELKKPIIYLNKDKVHVVENLKDVNKSEGVILNFS